MTRLLARTARTAAAALAGNAILLFARLVTAPQAVWAGVAPDATQRIYFANHSSHGDLVLMWAALPAPLRRRTRPVAAADYWLGSGLRRFVGCEVFRAVLVTRGSPGGPEGGLKADPRGDPGGDPIGDMARALDAGDSLILFPEGTRNVTGRPLLAFKGGLHRLAEARPAVELVPAWIGNLNRVLPKGEVVPVPLLCRVTFGAPLRLGPGEDRGAFLARARRALLELGGEGDAPPEPPEPTPATPANPAGDAT